MKKGSDVQSKELTMAKGKLSPGDQEAPGLCWKISKKQKKKPLESQNQSIKERGKTWRFAALSLPEVRTGCRGDAGE